MWSSLSTFIAAAIASLCGLAIGWSLFAQRAKGSGSTPKSDLQLLERRLTDCEQLQTEMLQHLARIEARDKMRQVRAARTEKQQAASQAPPEPSPEPSSLSELPSSELRRRLAMRQPLVR